jgi:hypothetical protein
MIAIFPVLGKRGRGDGPGIEASIAWLGESRGAPARVIGAIGSAILQCAGATGAMILE